MGGIVYIIDKNKDYYDYYMGIYGIDKTITYDRRGSTVLSEKRLLDSITHEFNATKSIEYFVLEVGTIQYLFRVNVDYKLPYKLSQFTEPYKGEFSLNNVFKDHRHYFETEISLVPARINHGWYWQNKRNEDKVVKSWREIEVQSDKMVSNPILKDTSIASFIDPKDIWIELTNFISSKYNDKTVNIVNTDMDKIVNHGFDKKSSFRNPIKL
jgi:hypothetical protein